MRPGRRDRRPAGPPPQAAAAAVTVASAGLASRSTSVLHRSNVDRLAAIAELAVGARRRPARAGPHPVLRLGLAQPGRPDADRRTGRRGDPRAAEAGPRHGERLEFVYVDADYHGGRPKPCMNGWGSRQFVVAPNGDVLPCLAAAQLPSGGRPTFARTSPASGTTSTRSTGSGAPQWMPEPCQSCALQGGRLRWVPVPGVPAHRRPGGDRSRLRPLARPPPRRGPARPTVPARSSCGGSGEGPGPRHRGRRRPAAMELRLRACANALGPADGIATQDCLAISGDGRSGISSTPRPTCGRSCSPTRSSCPHRVLATRRCAASC